MMRAPRLSCSPPRRAAAARRRNEAAVLVVEDLHWIDDASAAILEQLVEAVVGTRTLLVATYRSENETTWAADGMHARLRLGPLARDATDDLLTGRLGSDRSLDGLAALIEARAGG